MNGELTGLPGGVFGSGTGFEPARPGLAGTAGVGGSGLPGTEPYLTGSVVGPGFPATGVPTGVGDTYVPPGPAPTGYAPPTGGTRRIGGAFYTGPADQPATYALRTFRVDSGSPAVGGRGMTGVLLSATNPGELAGFVLAGQGGEVSVQRAFLRGETFPAADEFHARYGVQGTTPVAPAGGWLDSPQLASLIDSLIALIDQFLDVLDLVIATTEAEIARLLAQSTAAPYLVPTVTKLVASMRQDIIPRVEALKKSVQRIRAALVAIRKQIR